MAETRRNAVGDDLIVDPGTPERDRARHPAVGDLKEDDKVPGKVEGDAEANDPPVRTNRPDVPIIQRLGVGAGEHTPPTDPHIDEQGRWHAETVR